MTTPLTDLAVAQALLAQKAEIERLRKLVRRLADSLDIAADALWQANITRRVAITQPEPRSRHLHGVDIDALLREAREALKEIQRCNHD